MCLVPTAIRRVTDGCEPPHEGAGNKGTKARSSAGPTCTRNHWPISPALKIKSQQGVCWNRNASSQSLLNYWRFTFFKAAWWETEAEQKWLHALWPHPCLIYPEVDFCKGPRWESARVSGTSLWPRASNKQKSTVQCLRRPRWIRAHKAQQSAPWE